MTEELFELKNRIPHYNDMAKKNPTYKDLSKYLHKQYRLQLQSTKKEYYYGTIRNSLNKSKAMWHTIKKIQGKNKNVPDISISLDGVKINNEEVANCFNLHFTTSSNNSNSPNDYNFLMSNVPFSVNTCFLPPLSELDGILLINKLKASNSSGFDNISNNLLKNVNTCYVIH